MMTVKQFMDDNFFTIRSLGFGVIRVIRPRAICADGYSVSIQGSVKHYCSPREWAPEDGFTEVELGYPSEPDELIEDYAEDPEDLTGTVYGRVPVELVQKLVDKHGGIIGVKTEQIEEFKKERGPFDILVVNGVQIE